MNAKDTEFLSMPAMKALMPYVSWIDMTGVDEKPAGKSGFGVLGAGFEHGELVSVVIGDSIGNLVDQMV